MHCTATVSDCACLGCRAALRLPTTVSSSDLRSAAMLFQSAPKFWACLQASLRRLHRSVGVLLGRPFCSSSWLLGFLAESIRVDSLDRSNIALYDPSLLMISALHAQPALHAQHAIRRHQCTENLVAVWYSVHERLYHRDHCHPATHRTTYRL